MAGLNDTQLGFYRDEGYLLLEDVFDPSLLAPLKAELEDPIDAFAREAHRAGELGDLHEDAPFEQRLALLAAQLADPDRILRQMNGKLKTPGMFKILTSPALLDIVEATIGPEILAHPQFNLRAKLPNQDASVVPWHQDLGYLEADAAETFMVNFWIPLVDATAENGCMEVLAASHRQPLIEHRDGLGPAGNFKGIADTALPPGKAVLCPVRRGGVLLIQHKTIHRSIPNLSDHIRWSLDLRYCDPRLPTGREEVPGFIARSAAHPESVAHSLEDWLETLAAGRVAYP
jgi:phytanoyl-CoA hydroxylase